MARTCLFFSVLLASSTASAQVDGEVDETTGGIEEPVAEPTEEVLEEEEEEAEEEAEEEEEEEEEPPSEAAPAETPAPEAQAQEPAEDWIELAPEDEEEAEPEDPGLDEMRGLRDSRFARAEENTVLGGYGELHYNLVFPEGGESDAEIDLHRLVLFLAHQLGESFRFYTEIEVEHALSGDGLPGQVGVEQAFVDWLLADDALGLRAGIVLTPMGIVNQWHEPPVFNGVERPMVDKVIIPTTWREAGIGVFGEPVEGFRYEAYLVGGLNPAAFRTRDGLRRGRQAVAEARADGPAVMARVEVEPTLGFVAGASGYFSVAGANATVDGSSVPVDGDVPIVGASVDARVRVSGFEARAVGAYFSIGDTDALAAAVDDMGIPLGIDSPSAVLGAYGEVGFDVLSPIDTEQALVPFARLEWYDPTFRHRDGATQGSGATTDVVLGLSYRPIEELVFKADTILRTSDSGDATILDLGVGWMF